MKRLLITIVFAIAGLTMMAQENNTPFENSLMIRKKSNLCFAQGTDKKVIIETELLSLLGEDTFNSYCVGKKFYKIGNGLKTGGWCALGAGAALNVLGYALYPDDSAQNSNDPNHNNQAWKIIGRIGVLVFAEGCTLIPAGYIIRGIGSKKINRIAEEYNQSHQTSSVSYRITPSLIPFCTSESQTNLAYGMSMSVSF